MPAKPVEVTTEPDEVTISKTEFQSLMEKLASLEEKVNQAALGKMPQVESPDQRVKSAQAKLDGRAMQGLKLKSPGEMAAGMRVFQQERLGFQPYDVVRLRDDSERAHTIRTDKLSDKGRVLVKAWSAEKPIIGVILSYRYQREADGERIYSVRFPEISDGPTSAEACTESELELVERANS